MSRLLTYKVVQTHTQCVCGYNVVDQEKILISHNELKKYAQFKKRISGNYYFVFQQIDCKNKGHEQI
jgi:hypothetical protein